MPNGLGLVHTIGCTGGHNQHDPFIQKYIFLTPISQTIGNNERSGAVRARHSRCGEHRDTLRVYGASLAYALSRELEQLSHRYDKSFLRMWEYSFHCAIAASYASDLRYSKRYFPPIDCPAAVKRV